ncbi:hypothetical protein CJJ18_10630 (plasmid) [Candidatus Williamhamiltonella defendens]|uniref:Uncharacterized protein n=1 Tax=Candidatus Williamhamiltonella defendens TaxID=138072 RepID=A0AAC9VNN9_9ENTR|nr:hypothetical protein CJJ18_10630 [Candidatus Hamiltonella defensa]
MRKYASVKVIYTWSQIMPLFCWEKSQVETETDKNVEQPRGEGGQQHIVDSMSDDLPSLHLI